MMGASVLTLQEAPVASDAAERTVTWEHELIDIVRLQILEQQLRHGPCHALVGLAVYHRHLHPITPKFTLEKCLMWSSTIPSASSSLPGSVSQDMRRMSMGE